MKFYKKIFSPMDQFVDPPKFIITQLVVLLFVGLGLDASIQSNTIDVIGMFCSISLLVLNFSITNYLYGALIFNDNKIWPCRFMLWEVVDISSSSTDYSLEEMEFWCSYNCKKNSWRLTYNKWMIFKNTDDAFMFRMVW